MQLFAWLNDLIPLILVVWLVAKLFNCICLEVAWRLKCRYWYSSIWLGMEDQNESPDTTWKLLDEQECYPQRNFPISYSNHCPSLYEWHFGLSVQFLFFGDVISGCFHQGVEDKLSGQNVAATCICLSSRVACFVSPWSQAVAHWYEKERESWVSQQNIGFVKLHSGKRF